MVKHTQTIRWQIADELFECVWPFCGVGALKVNKTCMFTIMTRMTETLLFLGEKEETLPMVNFDKF